MGAFTVYKQDHHGRRVWQYSGEVLERGDTWVCLRAVFDRDEANLGFVVFQRGDVFIEWFYADRWYNVFQVHDGDGLRLKGWYCNITRPAAISADCVAADDLALDVYVLPNGTMLLLDENEFGALDLAADERMAALRAVEAIRLAVARRDPPFDAVREGLS